MPASGLPFDDVRALLAQMPAASDTCARDARDHEESLDRPFGSLGRLEAIVEHLARWQARSRPAIERPLVAIFAASHGVATRHADTWQRSMRLSLDDFVGGGAAVNSICAASGIGLRVFDLALEMPTRDIVRDAALDEAACAATIAFGMEAIANGTDLLCLGAVGPGNIIAAAALCHALYGGAAEDWVPPGIADRAAITADVAEAVAFHDGRRREPLEILRRLGGRDSAAIVGAILAARMERVPVVLDGYVVGAAAAVLHALAPGSLDHCLAGHCSGSAAHRALLARLDLPPLLDLGISLEDGTGAALAAGLVKTALACHTAAPVAPIPAPTH